MKSFAAGRFNKARKIQLFQKSSNLMCALNDPRPWDGRIGVQIEKHPVREFELVCLRAPDMNFKRPDLRQRHQVLNLVYDQIGPGAAALFDRDPSNRLRRVDVWMLLKKNSARSRP